MRPNEKRTLLVGALLVCALSLISAPLFAQTGAGTLSIPKRGYAPGEQIIVTFTAPAGLPTNAWVGIIPSSVPHGSEATNDQNDITYQYLNGRTSGTLAFTAPTKDGTYDFRMHDTDNNGTEIASVTFTVGGGSSLSASLNLNKYSFSPGESIAVNFTAPAGLSTSAWVGIIPSSVPHGSEVTNDQNDIAYQYLSGKTKGTLYFTAPTAAGSYDFRMNDSDSNGRELTSVTFTVK